jgi:Zn-finger nucleic acid-binding protein
LIIFPERKDVIVNCPVCVTELKVSERQNIEIDFCPQCRGVWLDRGELDKIIARSGSQSQYDNDDNDEEDGLRPQETRRPKPPEGRKREGFFSQLFDFD